MIVLEPPARKRLRQALIKHRQSYPQSEGEYVKSVLKVALNTYKKCIAPPNGDALTLKRHTLIGLLNSAKIEPTTVGIDVVLPSKAEQYGNYDPKDYAFLVGTYYLHRRSFMTALNIVRGVIEIRIDAEKRCLAFEEYNNYISDSGNPDDNRYTGEIFMNSDRSLLGLLATPEGQVRLLMTQSPLRNGPGNAGTLQRAGIRLRGSLLTHGRGKGVWQPTMSAISIESLPERMWQKARAACRTITPDDKEFKDLDREICYAEEYATVTTPLMYAKSRTAQPSAFQPAPVPPAR
jgi:hypothetical protein